MLQSGPENFLAHAIVQSIVNDDLYLSAIRQQALHYDLENLESDLVGVPFGFPKKLIDVCEVFRFMRSESKG